MRNLLISNRARITPPSPIRKLAHLAVKAKKSGTHVYHLNIGQPDIESPKEFFDGIREFSQKVVAYEQSQGNDLLCSAWSRYVNRTLGLKTNPGQYIVTMGASEALVFMFQTCCDPGDEVIVFDPTYANYLGFSTIAGVNIAPVPSNMENDFALPGREEIESRITNHTRAILVCNPNNPTGTVYTRDELRLLFDICEEHNLFLLVDETYRELVYDGLEPLSIFHVVPKSDRIVIIDSLSKRFSLCGARIGCLITTNEQVLTAVLKIAQARLAAPTIEQFAAAYMLENIPDSYFFEMRRKFAERRDTLDAALKQVPGVSAHKPKGAFYTFVRFPVADAEDFAAFMLDKFSHNGKTTFIAPAAGFYMQSGLGRHEARIACVLEKSSIEDAVETLAMGLVEYVK